MDACRTVPVIKVRTNKEMDKTAIIGTTVDQMAAATTTTIKTILVIDPAGVALAGLVDPVVDLLADRRWVVRSGGDHHVLFLHRVHTEVQCLGHVEVRWADLQEVQWAALRAV